VNRRLVRDRLLLHAIGEAYRNIVPPGVFPVVLLFLELPYQEVDVNVHPAKIEVRFRHPQFVHDFTRDALRHALSLARPIPGFPAAARAAAVSIGVPPSANGGAASAADPLGPESFSTPGALPGPPRAVIPTSFGSGTAAASTARTLAEGFELSGAPDQPIPQRLAFEPGTEMNFPVPMAGAGAPSAFVVRGSCRRVRAGSGCGRIGGFPSRARGDSRSEAARAGEQQLHRRGKWRGPVDHRPARGP
jgi:DNA mismatch repair protein MutL